MTTLNFPASPTVGKTYAANNVIYTWNGTFWAANNAQDLDARFVNVTGDTMTGNLTVPSINGGQLAGFRNILVNGNLTINQRGVNITAAATGKYGQDRWKKTAAGMTQIIEAGNFEPGATYTLSGTGVTTKQLKAPTTGDWTLPDIPVTARKIQLELGTVATPFEHRPIGIELALCQRYFQKLTGFIVSADVSGVSRVTWSFKTDMRIAPAVNWASDGNKPTSTLGTNTESVTGVRTHKTALAPGSTADAEL